MADHVEAVTVEQCDRDAAAAFIAPSDGDFGELSELFARHRTQANEAMREALEHWDAQATCWLESREQHARPGWMQPAIDKGRRALSGDRA